MTAVWSSPALDEVGRVLQQQTGLVFPDTRRDIAEATIRSAMARVGLSDLRRYADLLGEGGAALDELVAELTVGETYFFRESAQLNFIRDTIIPDILRRAGNAHTIRIWSAGCASGEEPYSLGILLHEMRLADRARILGTEISRPRLAAARQGRYGKWSMRGVPQEIVSRWFTLRGAHYLLDPTIRRMVDFRYLNLASDSYPASSTGVWGMDLILCRNVLIYFDADTVRAVAGRLLSSLTDQGWLILGASDPMIGEMVECEVVMTGAGLAYRRREAGSKHRDSGLGTRDSARGDQVHLAEVPSPESRVPSPDALPHPPRSEINNELVSSYRARDYSRAAELARAVLREMPDEAKAWIYLVRSLANGGKIEEASAACRQALARHPHSAELAYLHSLLLTESGRPGDAAAAARRALYLDRTMIVAHIALGSALARSGDPVGARRGFANAEELLGRMEPREIVPASDGESAFRLREIVRAQGSLLRGDAA
ncbi:MAG TPA: CheR family methyltransferase [Gemmatimonadaceae bacterium]|nr:CheR family methyltransferase [Gemmatimonadaceae bacterium]